MVCCEMKFMKYEKLNLCLIFHKFKYYVHHINCYFYTKNCINSSHNIIMI